MSVATKHFPGASTIFNRCKITDALLYRLYFRVFQRTTSPAPLPFLFDACNIVYAIPRRFSKTYFPGASTIFNACKFCLFCLPTLYLQIINFHNCKSFFRLFVGRCYGYFRHYFDCQEHIIMERSLGPSTSVGTSECRRPINIMWRFKRLFLFRCRLRERYHCSTFFVYIPTTRFPLKTIINFVRSATQGSFNSCTLLMSGTHDKMNLSRTKAAKWSGAECRYIDWAVSVLLYCDFTA